MFYTFFSNVYLKLNTLKKHIYRHPHQVIKQNIVTVQILKKKSKLNFKV